MRRGATSGSPTASSQDPALLRSSWILDPGCHPAAAAAAALLLRCCCCCWLAAAAGLLLLLVSSRSWLAGGWLLAGWLRIELGFSVFTFCSCESENLRSSAWRIQQQIAVGACCCRSGLRDYEIKLNRRSAAGKTFLEQDRICKT
jgi:hypothetical protein